MVQEIEEQIVRSAVRELLDQGYRLSVDNGGEDYEIEHSADYDAVMAEMMATDDEYLVVSDSATGRIMGHVYFVYGNDGHDVIADYSVSVAPLLPETEKLAKELGDEG